jgi:hypothetical protein
MSDDLKINHLNKQIIKKPVLQLIDHGESVQEKFKV